MSKANSNITTRATNIPFELVMLSGDIYPGTYSGQLINGLPHGDGSWTSADRTRAYQG